MARQLSSMELREKACAKAIKQQTRTWEIPPLSNEPLSLHEASEKALNTVSKTEQRVFDYLTKHDFEPQRLGVSVSDILTEKEFVLHPDMMIVPDDDNTPIIAVEVDSPAEHNGGRTHGQGFPADDLYRDDCLRAQGIAVVRLRLGGLEAVPDAFNVLRKGSLTQTMLKALADAIRAAQAGDDPFDITVAPPVPQTKAKSPLGSIRVEGTSDFYTSYETWWTKPNGSKIKLNLPCNGRFLYYYGTFIAEINFDQVPFREWRTKLPDVIPAAIEGKYLRNKHRTDHGLPFKIDRELNHRIYPRYKNDPQLVVCSWKLDDIDLDGCGIYIDQDQVTAFDDNDHIVWEAPVHPGLRKMGYELYTVDLKTSYLYLYFLLSPR